MGRVSRRKKSGKFSGPILVCVVSIVGGCLRGLPRFLVADFRKGIRGRNSGNFRVPILVCEWDLNRPWGGFFEGNFWKLAGKREEEPNLS